MKKYETPELDIVRFVTDDVITGSANDPNETDMYDIH